MSDTVVESPRVVFLSDASEVPVVASSRGSAGGGSAPPVVNGERGRTGPLLGGTRLGSLARRSKPDIVIGLPGGTPSLDNDSDESELLIVREIPALLDRFIQVLCQQLLLSPAQFITNVNRDTYMFVNVDVVRKVLDGMEKPEISTEEGLVLLVRHIRPDQISSMPASYQPRAARASRHKRPLITSNQSLSVCGCAADRMVHASPSRWVTIRANGLSMPCGSPPIPCNSRSSRRRQSGICSSARTAKISRTHRSYKRCSSSDRPGGTIVDLFLGRGG